MRIGCLLVPDMPLVARMRAEPDLVGSAVAVADGFGARAVVLCASPEARQRAVRQGHTVTQARAICPELVVRAASSETERSAEAALRDVALSFSSRVEKVTRPAALYATVHLDLDGSGAMWASERDIVLAMEAAARRVGLEARAGIAGSRGVARIAALSGLGVVEEDRETASMALLPVDVLSFGELGAAAVTETLRRWGIGTVGDFALLPSRGTFERLGPVGQRLMELGRGIDRTPLCPAPVDERFVEAIDLEYSIFEVEPLAFVLRGLIDRVIGRLTCRALAAGSFDLGLSLDPRGTDDRHVAVAAPTRDVQSLVRLARLAIEEHPPSSAVTGVRLCVQAAELRAEQMSLFGPRAPAPARLATTLARLASLVGPDRVGAPVVPDTHDPAAFDLGPFAPRMLDEAPLAADAPSRCLARRMIRPPRVAEVFCDRALPTYVRSEGMGGRVVQIAGPWRTRHGWWRGGAVPSSDGAPSGESLSDGAPSGESHRDDFDVALSDGGVYRIFHDLVNGGWFVDAQYD